MAYLLGTDIGTLGTKSVLVKTDGRVLSSAFEEYDVLAPRPGWAEQWPDVWFGAVTKTIKAVVEHSGINPAEVAGLCISGLYGGSGIPCDKEMKPLRPCIIWADRRATAECDWVRQNIGVDRLFKLTGNVVDPYYGYAKMLWIKFNEPKVWSRIDKLMTPNAYCIYRLTGNPSIDLSSAGNYGGLLDIQKRDWSEEAMDALGIPRSFFPERLSMSKEVVGELTEEGSRLTGLKRGTPVSAGGIDAPVSALSVGALEDGDLASMLGTSMCNGFISRQPRLSPQLVNYPYVADDREALYSFAGIVTAGYCVRWFRDQLGKVEAKIAQDLDLSAYAILDLEAEKVPAGSEGLIFLPHMMVGERAPYWDDYVRGCLIGLTLYHTRAHIFRAFLEGIAYALRYSLEAAAAAGMPLKRALLVNGGAKSTLWRSILADVTGLSMTYIAQSPGAPLGDALLAGVGTGTLEGYHVINEWLEVSEVTKPDLGRKKTYDRYYALYLQLYNASKGIFKALKDVTG
ncbi:MAG: FGGY-family carbohydrate kinase [Candidatus Bathyarchaeia archaeon]